MSIYIILRINESTPVDPAVDLPLIVTMAVGQSQFVHLLVSNSLISPAHATIHNVLHCEMSNLEWRRKKTY